MANTILTAFTFCLLTTVIYLLLSTLHIYCPAPSSPSSSPLDGPLTHDPDPDPPPANPITTSTPEFLFRIANLHIYGIRALFIAVVVGGSTLAAVGVVYWALALRRGVVGWDVSERWRVRLRSGERRPGRGTPQQSRMMSGREILVGGGSRWGPAGRYSNAVPSFMFFYSSASSSSRRRRDSSRTSVARSNRVSRWGEVTKLRRSGVQQARRAVSFLRGGTHERDMRMRRLERAVEEYAKMGGDLGGGAATVGSVADKISSGCDIPSYYYYISDSNRQSAVRFEPDSSAAWRSSGIPSYYYKEHDEDGRSIFGSEKHQRPSFGLTELIDSSRKPAVASSGSGLGTACTGRDDTGQVPPYHGDPVTRSLTGSTAVSKNDWRRSVLNGSDMADTTVGQAGQARRKGDDGWDTVYCLGWKGMDTVAS